MNISIKTIPHEKQRYPTCGDYFFEGNTLNFRISKFHDWRYEALIMIHELVEYFLIRQRGISIKEIDEFDRLFEEERSNGSHRQDEEPGFDPRAPYRREHSWAHRIERLASFLMCVNWKEYNRIVNSL